MHELGRHLRELIVASDDYRRTMASGIDVSTNEASVLGELLHEGNLTPSRIGARTGLTPASATALIDRLVSAELVVRTAHPDDGRRVLVSLTDRGRAAIEATFSLFTADLDDALRQAESRLVGDPDPRRTLADLLSLMAAALRTRAADRARVASSVSEATGGQAVSRPARPGTD